MPTAFDRLSPLDRYFLIYEHPATPMHVGGVQIVEAGPLRKPDGGLDIARIRAFIESRLPGLPRYRQVVATTPFGTPIWLDDPHFNLEYHVRHTALPRPGDDAQLKALCGRIFSQALDRAKPLWEVWIVEGGSGDHFAFVSKIHHAMADGISAVDLLEATFTHEPTTDFEPAKPWVARPRPSAALLARKDVTAVVGATAQLARRVSDLVTGAFRADSDARAAFRGFLDLTLKTIRRPSRTPFNQRIGPHRRFDWVTIDLAEVKGVRRAFGGSLNDVVLATVAGAVRRFLEHRGMSAQGIEFRVMAPVSMRPPEARGTLGNQVAAWMVPLPIGERDPRERLAIVQRTTAKLKQERNALGSGLLTDLVGWTPATLLSLAAAVPFRDLPFNMVVTNVPGPQRPVYLLGAKMITDYGLVPLADYNALGIVLFSYEGKLSWGFNADWDALPDVDVFVRCVRESFKELRDLVRPQAKVGAPSVAVSI